MAMPQAFGFMPMQQALRINAGLDNPGVMDMLGRGGAPQPQVDPSEQLMQILMSHRSQDYGMSPAGPSMQRRFGAGSPLGMEMLPDEQAVPPQVGPSAEEVAQLQSALMAAAQASGQADPFMVTRQGTSGTYAGPAIRTTGALQAEPWYDEYVAAAQGGADLPMVRGQGQYSPDFAQKQQALRDSRSAERGSRQANVQRNAMMKSAARRQDMTGLTDPSYVQMMMEALGAADDGGMARNAMLYGPEVAQNLHTVDMQGGMANEARQQQQRQFEQELAMKQAQFDAENARANAQQQFQQGMLQDPRYWAAQGVGVGDQLGIGSLMGIGGGASGSMGGLPQLPPSLISNPDMPQQQLIDMGAQSGILPNQMQGIAGALGRKEPWNPKVNLINGGQGAIQPSFWDILKHFGDFPADRGPGNPIPYY